MSSLDDAHALLREHPVIDGHNDLPYELRVRCLGRGSPITYDASVDDIGAGIPALHTDLPRMRRGRVGGQFWSAFVPSTWVGEVGVRTNLEQVALIKSMVARHAGDMAFCRTAADVEQAIANGLVASLVGVEGGHAINSSLERLNELADAGVRYLTLTHNDNTPWADSATDEPNVGGLTDFGREVVRELNRRAVLVDLSHVAPTTMHAALDVSTAPVIFSHSSCRALCDHARNAPDDVLLRLAENGGVVMITFVPHFLTDAAREWTAWAHAQVRADGGDVDHAGGVGDAAGVDLFVELERQRPYPAAALADIVAHLNHARRVCGPNHIGLGGDFDGVRVLPRGMPDVSGYPALFAALLEDGWSHADLAGLACRNVLRVLRTAEEVA